MKISVHFNNDYTATFADDTRVEFRGGDDYPTVPVSEYGGRVLVNWANVCFVSPVPEKKEDEDEA